MKPVSSRSTRPVSLSMKHSRLQTEAFRFPTLKEAMRSVGSATRKPYRERTAQALGSSAPDSPALLKTGTSSRSRMSYTLPKLNGVWDRNDPEYRSSWSAKNLRMCLPRGRVRRRVAAV